MQLLCIGDRLAHGEDLSQQHQSNEQYPTKVDPPLQRTIATGMPGVDGKQTDRRNKRIG